MHDTYPEHDAAVRQWFERQEWPVTRINYDFDRDYLAWRHEGRPSRTLYISRTVIEDTPPYVLVTALDSFGVAEAMRRHPDAYTMLVQSATGGFGLVQPNELP